MRLVRSRSLLSNDHRNRRTPSWRHYAWWDLKLLRPFDLVVDDLACFLERLRRRRQRRRAGEPQAVLVVDRHDEPRLPRQVEAVEVISFGLEDHPAKSGRGASPVNPLEPGTPNSVRRAT